MPANPGSPLDPYRAKRNPNATPEPFGGAGSDNPAGRPGGRLRFVVQKHSARRMHYDLRLEWGGVLRSWAVPKGPSADPAEKRLAVAVEDHPVEYAAFEGTIPSGNYGAGAVILWDRGTWRPIGDVEAGFEAGKLLFELEGCKLRGVWTLVRLKKSAKDWLLIKERDAFATPEGSKPYPEGSILSGLTVDELGDGVRREAELVAEAVRLGAPQRVVAAADVDVMLAETLERPITDPAFIFEVKYDGFRLVAAREGGAARLHYRRGRESTAIFPDVAAAVAALPFDRIVLDGEVAVLDATGRPRFALLQQRTQLERPQDIALAAAELPATYFAFDLLAVGDRDLRPLPLVERKRLLRRALPAAGPLRFADHVEERGAELFEQAKRMGLEGIMGKRAASPYRAGRSGDWVKMRVDRTADFAVVGFTKPEGTRTGFRALDLAAREGEGLVYVGRAGSGFSEKELAETRKALDAIVRKDPPCTGPIPTAKGHTWVEPRLVCEVRYMEFTSEGILRQPTFLRFRPDKKPEECPMPADAIAARATADAAIVATSTRPTEVAAPPRLVLSNLKKPYWPDGTTKGELIEYYRAIWPWLSTYLRDRPVVLTRYPDGIDGKSFYQKDAPVFTPQWIRTTPLWSEETQRDIAYFVCDELDALLYVANLGSIPLHIWSSRAAAIQRPDWSILDLDPKGAPFADVVRVALAIRALCEEIGLPSFVKTSGSTGLHVLVPLGGQCTYDQSRGLAELLARVVETELPAIATTVRVIEARGGRVYLDYLQNRSGQLLAAPFSVRPLKGAPVSTPLAWSEVGPALDPAAFTLRTVPERMQRLAEDPMAAVLTTAPDLATALERLGPRLARARP